MRIKDILLETPSINDKTDNPAGLSDMVWDDSKGSPPEGMGTELRWVGTSTRVKSGKEVPAARVYAFPDPSTNNYTYNSVEDLDTAIDQFKSQGSPERSLGAQPMIFINARKRSSNPEKYKAFGVALAKDENNKLFWITKYLDTSIDAEKYYGNGQVDTDNVIDTSDLKFELGYVPRKSRSEGSASANSPIPTDLSATAVVPNFREFQTVDQIVKGIESSLKDYDPQFTEMAKQAAAGTNPVSVTMPIPARSANLDPKLFNRDASNFFGKVNVDYPEVLQPLLMVSGALTVDQYPISPNAKISYTHGPAGMYDSVIDNGKGDKVYISTKKQTGAANVLGEKFRPYLDKLPKEDQAKYQTQYNIVNSISRNSGWPKNGELGPLEAATMVPKPTISKPDAQYFSKTFGTSKNFDKSYDEYGEAFWQELTRSHPALKTLIDTAVNSTPSQKKSPFHLTLKYIMDDMARQINSDPTKMMEKFLNLLFSQERIVFVSSSPQISRNETTVTDTIKFSAYAASEARPIPVALLSSETYMIDGRGEETRMKFKLGISSDAGAAKTNGRLAPAPLAAKKQALQPQQTVTAPQAPATPTVDPQVQQQIIQSLRAPGTPLNKALLSITDPTERSEAEQEVLDNAKLGKSAEQVLADLQGWLAESAVLNRIKHLVNYK